MQRMNAYSEDLRKKIVEALGRGMTKTEAARTFGVSRSSVKRYAKLAEEGRPLAPKKRPGSKPKMDERFRRQSRRRRGPRTPTQGHVLEPQGHTRNHMGYAGGVLQGRQAPRRRGTPALGVHRPQRRKDGVWPGESTPTRTRHANDIREPWTQRIRQATGG